MPALTTNVTRLGLYGGARPDYGAFTGKTLAEVNSSEFSVMISGQGQCHVAGVAEQISVATIKIRKLKIVAQEDNAGQVYLGASDVDNTVNDGLKPGEILIIEPLEYFDLNEVFLDVDTSGDGLDYYAFKA